MKTPEFLGMTLSDMFAEIDHCKAGLLRAASSHPPAWSEARNYGHHACYLSQCIVAEISNRKRRRDMPCNQACELLRAFTSVVRQLLTSADAAGRIEAEDLVRYAGNMDRRAEELGKMARESEDLDKTVFGLETEEIPIEHSKS
jgi:hypothetical protein